MEAKSDSSVAVQRWWLSWYQAGSDHRPMTYPPNESILGWWCTGSGPHGGFEDVDILCALVQAGSEDAAWAAALKDWPDMIDRRFIGPRDADYMIHSDRFPLSDWMIPRMKPHTTNPDGEQGDGAKTTPESE